MATTSACLIGEDGQGSDEGAVDTTSTFSLPKEKFLYTVAINRGGTADPDMVFIVGTDPRDTDTYGKIVKRVDMPNAGDEVHHFAYSHDKQRLLVPGVFSGRMNVFDVSDPSNPTLKSVGNTMTTGYIVPHSVIPRGDGRTLVTMIGANTATTGPGGIIEINDWTGNAVENFGPGPSRSPSDLGPEFMYDFDYNAKINRGISTTFGLPANVGGGINPAGLGNTVSVWDYKREKVIQVADLGTNSGALEVRFSKKSGSTHGYINTPGTGAVWLFEDDDHDGFFTFHPVITTGLAIPVDMLISLDGKYMYLTNWFGDNVQQYDLTDEYNPRLVATATVPHANMIRLSVDGKRLYVTNELLSTWDDDPNFGPPRNTNYGLWAFDVDVSHGGLTSFSPGTTPWVQFDSVQKQSTVGPAGPHMMLFDPAASPADAH